LGTFDEVGAGQGPKCDLAFHTEAGPARGA
jgi:hypothetical protein